MTSRIQTYVNKSIMDVAAKFQIHSFKLPKMSPICVYKQVPDEEHRLYHLPQL